MSPMSLVNLPASSLREAPLHDEVSPCGERAERRWALWMLGGAATASSMLIVLIAILT